MVQAGCDLLKQVLTSCCVWQVNSVAWLVMSLQIQNSNNVDVLLDSGLNLFDIMANLCSKLYCEVLLKSWNYIEVDFCFGLQQERLCKTDLSGLKLSVSIPNPCSKLLCTEVREVTLLPVLYSWMVHWVSRNVIHVHETIKHQFGINGNVWV